MKPDPPFVDAYPTARRFSRREVVRAQPGMPWTDDLLAHMRAGGKVVWARTLEHELATGSQRVNDGVAPSVCENGARQQAARGGTGGGAAASDNRMGLWCSDN